MAGSARGPGLSPGSDRLAEATLRAGDAAELARELDDPEALGPANGRAAAIRAASQAPANR